MGFCKIEAININNKRHFNKMNEPFTRFGSVFPSFINNKWKYEYTLLENPYTFSLPNDEGINCDNYIDNSYNQIFFAIVNDIYVGQIRIRSNWNGLCFIEDVCIKMDYRGKGYLNDLLIATKNWAKDNKLGGLCLEVLSFNLGAFKSYIKCGFEIGGIDNMEYRFAGQDFITEEDVTIKMYKFI